MAKYFEATVTISKRVFLKVEDSETVISIYDYVFESYCNEAEFVEVSEPIELTNEAMIEQSRRFCDARIENV